MTLVSLDNSRTTERPRKLEPIVYAGKVVSELRDLGAGSCGLDTLDLSGTSLGTRGEETYPHRRCLDR